MNETASLEQLAALVDFSADAVVLVDADGVIRWANPATPDVLGYEPADLIGVRVRDLVEPEDQPAWSALVAGLFDRPPKVTKAIPPTTNNPMPMIAASRLR